MRLLTPLHWAGLPMFAVVLTCTSMAAQSGGETAKFEAAVTQVDIAPSGAQSYVAVVALRIKNSGGVPLQVAVLRRNLVLAVEGGFQFEAGYERSVSGISSCLTLDDCEKKALRFPVIQPGATHTASISLHSRRDRRELAPATEARLSGTIFLRDTVRNRTWSEPLTFDQLRVAKNTR